MKCRIFLKQHFIIIINVINNFKKVVRLFAQGVHARHSRNVSPRTVYPAFTGTTNHLSVLVQAQTLAHFLIVLHYFISTSVERKHLCIISQINSFFLSFVFLVSVF